MNRDAETYRLACSYAQAARATAAALWRGGADSGDYGRAAADEDAALVALSNHLFSSTEPTA